jgi:hypothetical protein
MKIHKKYTAYWVAYAAYQLYSVAIKSFILSVIKLNVVAPLTWAANRTATESTLANLKKINSMNRLNFLFKKQAILMKILLTTTLLIVWNYMCFYLLLYVKSLISKISYK